MFSKKAKKFLTCKFEFILKFSKINELIFLFSSKKSFKFNFEKQYKISLIFISIIFLQFNFES